MSTQKLTMPLFPVSSTNLSSYVSFDHPIKCDFTWTRGLAPALQWPFTREGLSEKFRIVLPHDSLHPNERAFLTEITEIMGATDVIRYRSLYNSLSIIKFKFPYRCAEAKAAFEASAKELPRDLDGAEACTYNIIWYILEKYKMMFSCTLDLNFVVNSLDQFNLCQSHPYQSYIIRSYENAASKGDAGQHIFHGSGFRVAVAKGKMIS